MESQVNIGDAVAVPFGAKGKKYVIFDIDNCLSDDRNRMSLIDWDAPNPTLKYDKYHKAANQDAPGNLDVYREWTSKGYKPLFLTARPDTIREMTIGWLKTHIWRPYENWLLLMRTEANHNRSADVKKWQLNQLASDYGIYTEDIVMAFDDRPEICEMYTNNGITSRVLKIHDVCAYTRPAIDVSANINDAKPETIRATAAEIRALEEFGRGFPGLRGEIPDIKKVTAADVLQGMTNTFRERQSVYKDNYKMVAKLMAVLFPDGVPPALVVEDQFHLFELMLVKLSRYAISNLTHIDSVHDLSVYGAMCEAINLNSERTK